MSAPSTLAERIESACRRAADGYDERALVAEIEDLLAEGYIEALRGEAHSRRLGERLTARLEALSTPAAVIEAQDLARERNDVDARVRDLRLRLGVLRDHHPGLGGGRSASLG